MHRHSRRDFLSSPLAAVEGGHQLPIVSPVHCSDYYKVLAFHTSSLLVSHLFPVISVPCWIPVFASVKIIPQFPIGSFPTFDLGEISLGFLSQLLTYFLIAVEGGQFSTLEKLSGQFRILYLFTKL